MFDINNTWIEFLCPKCSYTVEVRMIEVKTESTVPCYCCKTWIKLIDQKGSTHVGMNSIESALTQLENTLKKIGK